MIRSIYLCAVMALLVGCSSSSQQNKTKEASGDAKSGMQEMQQKLESLKKERARIASELKTLEMEADALVSAGATAKEISDNHDKEVNKAQERLDVEKQILELETRLGK